MDKTSQYKTGIIFIRSEGIDLTQIEVKGYLVNPMTFPKTFFLPAIVTCHSER